MVRIAIAGGTSNVGLEFIDALVATKKHSLLLLSRKDAPASEARPGVSWAKTNYQDATELAEVLKGVHTVLSFVSGFSDPEDMSQRNIIDACVQAGVKRFAPSEWATSSFEHIPHYAGKSFIRQYLADLNKHKKILEYTLFQPGLFTNYLAHPHPTAKHFKSFETMFDFCNRRAIIIEGNERDIITLTTVQDCARVVCAAVEYEGAWPVNGGMNGGDISVGELLKLGEKTRGGPFKVTRLARSDLEAGKVDFPWVPHIEHPDIPQDRAQEIVPQMLVGLLLAMPAGAWQVGDQWNKLLPAYEFTGVHDFLKEHWQGRA